MCGIFGELSLKNTLIEKSKFLNLLELSKSRGPDKQGYFSNNSYLQFGFNRLSIIDLTDNGDQPMFSNNKRFIMIFNGEIYNYLSLKIKLETYGVIFNSLSDSEVLINCFQYYGINKTLELIDGMFSIALFDNFEKKLHLIRDFAGIKPLHFAFNNKVVVFASQYNQIAKHPEFSDNSYNYDVLKLYLTQHFIPSPFGLIKDTYQVLPGEIITFSLDGKKTTKRFWEFPKKVYPTIFNQEEAINEIESSLNDSIKKQMVSDVPLGVFLSEGIDSTLISLFTKKNTNNPLKSFTIGSNSGIHDESKNAMENAKKIGLSFEIEMMNSNIAGDIIDKISSSITEPFADSSLIPTYYLSNMANKKVTVILSGDGADELFFGYSRFSSIVKNIKVQKFPYWLKYIIYGFDKVFFNNKNINSNSLFDHPGHAHLHLQQRFSFDLLNLIFPELKNISIPNNFDIYNYEYPKTKMDLLQFMRYAEFYGMMQKTLRKVDMASMHNSLEVRVPFLDKKLIKTALKIDPFLNFNKNIDNKNILRQVIIKNNKNLKLEKIKKGFSVPIAKWMRKGLQKSIKETIMDNHLINHFGLNKYELEKLLTNHIKNNKDNKWPIFTIYSLFKWKNNLS